MWVRIDDQFCDHPKQLQAGAALGRDGLAIAHGMTVWALTYAARYLTDGFLPRVAVQRCGRVRDPARAAAAVVAAGIWNEVEGGYQIHDYHDYQPPAEKVADLHEQRRAAGQRGGVRSGEVRRSKTQPNPKRLVSGLLEANTLSASSKTEAKPNPVPVPVKRERDLSPSREDPEQPVPVDTGPSEALAERAGAFARWYAEEAYPRWRNGAGYVMHPGRDYDHACRIVSAYPDDAWLRMMAEVYLRTEHPDARRVSRTLGQFGAMAGWCDAALRAEGARPSSPTGPAGAVRTPQDGSDAGPPLGDPLLVAGGRL